jgi:Holliday junction resolvase RusA-like endonuclease
MKEVKFSLPIKPFSINQKSCRDARYTTVPYKAWAQEAYEHMRQHSELVQFAINVHNVINPKYEIKLCAYYPFSTFYNKSGGVSTKTIDITNYEKLLVDVLFNEILNVNDKFIIKMLSEKKEAECHRIDVTLRLLD